jgi:hypothetical protein
MATNPGVTFKATAEPKIIEIQIYSCQMSLSGPIIHSGGLISYQVLRWPYQGLRIVNTLTCFHMALYAIRLSDGPR